MDCSKIRFGGGGLPVHRGVPELSDGSDHQNARSLSLFPVSNLDSSRRSSWRISAASTLAEIVKQHAAIEKQSSKRRGSGGGGGGGGREDHHREMEVERKNLDRWMGKSVTEIVKNLNQAPLLVHVYANDDGWVMTKTDKAEDWPVVKRRWERGEEKMPDGMIFVEQIDVGGDSSENRSRNCGLGDDDEITRAWGLVMQGRCVKSGPVCYVLKTNQVGAGAGTGILSTRFSLVRLMNLRENPQAQLEKFWLVGKSEGVAVQCGITF